ncbi:MAG TPA: nitrous oxide-stimulated promoter family protein [Candidatus Acidoferrales bacterium]|nr:nitrous oxide-stimulated promoter family protein [Candidatus Acidoferrales bacterium]
MNTTAEPTPMPGIITRSGKSKNDLAGARLARERRTMAAMARIHCRDKHSTPSGLCAECRTFLDYADARLERCRFGAEKPTCAKCPVHCYQRERREQAKLIMRYAGPRMLWEHPLMSLRHWLDGFRKAPEI